VNAAMESLVAEFPQIGEISGYFRPDRAETWPEFTWSEVVFRELDGPMLATGDVTLIRQQAIEFTGADDDLTALIEAISSGRYEMEDWEAIREMPIVKIPLTISGAVVPGIGFEEYEDELKTPSVRKQIQSIKKCYLCKSEETTTRVFSPIRQKSGIRIDSSRFADAVAMGGSGVPPRIFKVREDRNAAYFDPAQHYAIIAFDTNAFTSGSLVVRAVITRQVFVTHHYCERNDTMTSRGSR